MLLRSKAITRCYKNAIVSSNFSESKYASWSRFNQENKYLFGDLITKQIAQKKTKQSAKVNNVFYKCYNTNPITVLTYSNRDSELQSWHGVKTNCQSTQNQLKLKRCVSESFVTNMGVTTYETVKENVKRMVKQRNFEVKCKIVGTNMNNITKSLTHINVINEKLLPSSTRKPVLLHSKNFLVRSLQDVKFQVPTCRSYHLPCITQQYSPKIERSQSFDRFLCDKCLYNSLRNLNSRFRLGCKDKSTVSKGAELFKGQTSRSFFTSACKLKCNVNNNGRKRGCSKSKKLIVIPKLGLSQLSKYKLNVKVGRNNQHSLKYVCPFSNINPIWKQSRVGTLGSLDHHLCKTFSNFTNIQKYNTDRNVMRYRNLNYKKLQRIYFSNLGRCTYSMIRNKVFGRKINIRLTSSWSNTKNGNAKGRLVKFIKPRVKTLKETSLLYCAKTCNVLNKPHLSLFKTHMLINKQHNTDMIKRHMFQTKNSVIFRKMLLKQEIIPHNAFYTIHNPFFIKDDNKKIRNSPNKYKFDTNQWNRQLKPNSVGSHNNATNEDRHRREVGHRDDNLNPLKEPTDTTKLSKVNSATHRNKSIVDLKLDLARHNSPLNRLFRNRNFIVKKRNKDFGVCNKLEYRQARFENSSENNYSNVSGKTDHNLVNYDGGNATKETKVTESKVGRVNSLLQNNSNSNKSAIAELYNKRLSKNSAFLNKCKDLTLDNGLTTRLYESPQLSNPCASINAPEFVEFSKVLVNKAEYNKAFSDKPTKRLEFPTNQSKKNPENDDSPINKSLRNKQINTEWNSHKSIVTNNGNKLIHNFGEVPIKVSSFTNVSNISGDQLKPLPIGILSRAGLTDDTNEEEQIESISNNDMQNINMTKRQTKLENTVNKPNSLKQELIIQNFNKHITDSSRLNEATNKSRSDFSKQSLKLASAKSESDGNRSLLFEQRICKTDTINGNENSVTINKVEVGKCKRLDQAVGVNNVSFVRSYVRSKRAINLAMGRKSFNFDRSYNKISRKLNWVPQFKKVHENQLEKGCNKKVFGQVQDSKPKNYFRDLEKENLPLLFETKPEPCKVEEENELGTVSCASNYCKNKKELKTTVCDEDITESMRKTRNNDKEVKLLANVQRRLGNPAKQIVPSISGRVLNKITDLAAKFLNKEKKLNKIAHVKIGDVDDVIEDEEKNTYILDENQSVVKSNFNNKFKITNVDCGGPQKSHHISLGLSNENGEFNSRDKKYSDGLKSSQFNDNTACNKELLVKRNYKCTQNCDRPIKSNDVSQIGTGKVDYIAPGNKYISHRNAEHDISRNDNKTMRNEKVFDERICAASNAFASDWKEVKRSVVSDHDSNHEFLLDTQNYSCTIQNQTKVKPIAECKLTELSGETKGKKGLPLEETFRDRSKGTHNTVVNHAVLVNKPPDYYNNLYSKMKHFVEDYELIPKNRNNSPDVENKKLRGHEIVSNKSEKECILRKVQNANKKLMNASDKLKNTSIERNQRKCKELDIREEVNGVKSTANRYNNIHALNVVSQIEEMMNIKAEKGAYKKGKTVPRSCTELIGDNMRRVNGKQMESSNNEKKEQGLKYAGSCMNKCEDDNIEKSAVKLNVQKQDGSVSGTDVCDSCVGMPSCSESKHNLQYQDETTLSKLNNQDKDRKTLMCENHISVDKVSIDLKESNQRLNNDHNLNNKNELESCVRMKENSCLGKESVNNDVATNITKSKHVIVKKYLNDVDIKDLSQQGIGSKCDSLPMVDVSVNHSKQFINIEQQVPMECVATKQNSIERGVINSEPCIKNDQLISTYVKSTVEDSRNITNNNETCTSQDEINKNGMSSTSSQSSVCCDISRNSPSCEIKLGTPLPDKDKVDLQMSNCRIQKTDFTTSIDKSTYSKDNNNIPKDTSKTSALNSYKSFLFNNNFNTTQSHLNESKENFYVNNAHRDRINKKYLDGGSRMQRIMEMVQNKVNINHLKYQEGNIVSGMVSNSGALDYDSVTSNNEQQPLNVDSWFSTETNASSQLPDLNSRKQEALKATRTRINKITDSLRHSAIKRTNLTKISIPISANEPIINSGKSIEITECNELHPGCVSTNKVKENITKGDPVTCRESVGPEVGVNQAVDCVDKFLKSIVMSKQESDVKSVVDVEKYTLAVNNDNMLQSQQSVYTRKANGPKIVTQPVELDTISVEQNLRKNNENKGEIKSAVYVEKSTLVVNDSNARQSQQSDYISGKGNELSKDAQPLELNTMKHLEQNLRKSIKKKSCLLDNIKMYSGLLINEINFEREVNDVKSPDRIDLLKKASYKLNSVGTNASVSNTSLSNEYRKHVSDDGENQFSHHEPSLIHEILKLCGTSFDFEQPVICPTEAMKHHIKYVCKNLLSSKTIKSWSNKIHSVQSTPLITYTPFYQDIDIPLTQDDLSGKMEQFLIKYKKSAKMFNVFKQTKYSDPDINNTENHACIGSATELQESCKLDNIQIAEFIGNKIPPDAKLLTLLNSHKDVELTEKESSVLTKKEQCSSGRMTECLSESGAVSPVKLDFGLISVIVDPSGRELYDKNSRTLNIIVNHVVKQSKEELDVEDLVLKMKKVIKCPKQSEPSCEFAKSLIQQKKRIMGPGVYPNTFVTRNRVSSTVPVSLKTQTRQDSCIQLTLPSHSKPPVFHNPSKIPLSTFKVHENNASNVFQAQFSGALPDSAGCSNVRSSLESPSDRSTETLNKEHECTAKTQGGSIVNIITNLSKTFKKSSDSVSSSFFSALAIPLSKLQEFPMLNRTKTNLKYEDTKDVMNICYNVVLQNKNFTKPPSVTKILNATMSDKAKAALDNWKKKMIEKHGEEGFELLNKAKLEQGCNFHDCIKQHLLGMPLDSAMSSQESIANLLQSLELVMKNLSGVSVIESHVVHSQLPYHGIIDCVAKYNGKPALIEWKHSDKKKRYLQWTYDAPIQMSAYLGALNYDQNYEMPVDCGMVIVAYTDGTPADVFWLSRTLCERYWKIWLSRLHKYITLHNATPTS